MKVDSLRADRKFKKTEIGEIPVDWEVVRLGDICDVVVGSMPSTKAQEYRDGDVLWAVPTDTAKLKGNVISSTEKKISERGLAECAARLLPEGTILLTSRATLGESINKRFARLVCSENVCNLYMFYRLLFIREELEKLSSGSTFREVSKKSIRSIKVPLPPFPEQKKIAEILATVGEAIEKNSLVIEKTMELKKGLMQELLTRGIGHKKFKKTEIGEIPEEWEVVPLKTIAANKKHSFVDNPFGSNHKSIQYTDRAFLQYIVQYLRMNSIKNIKIPLPAIDEQIEITKYLSDADNATDKAIKQQKGLEFIKKGLMHLLLTGKTRVRN